MVYKWANKHKILKLFIIYLLASIAVAFIDFPLVWIIISSLKTDEEIFHIPIIYIPSKVTLAHYYKVSELGIVKAFVNSIIVASVTAILTLVISVLPAFAFAMFRFRGRNTLLLSILVTQTFPQIVFVIPFLFILKRLGLINNLFGVSLSYLPFTTPVIIWILISFFRSIPKDIIDSALVDGCSYIKALFYVVLPLIAPSLVASAIYAFVMAWSELMFQLTFLTTPDKMTISVFLVYFMGQYQTRWGHLYAGCTIAALVPLILFIFLEKYFVKGLVAGAIKG